ncbi:5-formyltetrahydrofolate cyclo-ligase [Conchiformibius kuhniae]|uniref:5-formyltetrahydrofolate cyclo-ligase n=1 Tax=Conchiformibius kuhniae TaxID=211502 RepID=A0A8T9MSI1_9NEIS|nr:5-formyltetrahydrofolate cyclo-ligase [Conchiformibius kuhniae]UOP04860.1 5-formyltetrahydrofolate cyclo-ligase [Conchiformibius kuhniae]
MIEQTVSDKAVLRRQLRRARAALAPAQRRRAERLANNALKPLIKRGKRIGVYWAAGSELRLDAFVRTAQQRGARLYLPYIARTGKRLWFTPYPAPSLRPERRRAAAPDIPQFGGRKIRAERLQMLIVPLVGIDGCGRRIGQGGGFYDATLAAAGSRRPLAVGAGFACQRCPAVPVQAHDMRVDAFACETGLVKFPK